MFNPSLLMREDLRRLKPYQPHDYPDTVKLDANENPYPFPAEALEEIGAMVGRVDFPRYPDPVANDLRRDLADYAGVQPEQILVGNGSDEIILNLAMAFGGGRSVVIAAPTFSMYRIDSQIAGAEPVEVPRSDNFDINAGVMVMAVRGTGAKLMILCSPNNPTGNATKMEVIEEIVDNTDALVVVDQAYIEFGGEDCVRLLDKYPNVAILRTFSKAFGLAGLRVGYLLASPAVINELMRIKQPYNLNSFSQMSARVALKYLPRFKAQWQKIIAHRDELSQQLSKMPGLEVYPSDANFILFRTGLDADFVHSRLIEKKVLIRNLGKDMPGYLRVSVGTAQENAVFIKALSEIIGEVK
ncbi:histidinol-phosphate transaminase [Desulfofalx alkaliphila]|uniref:histidinol-phosphate transaminase n=1 Tax=Desulfofalx alkaliphila TaxID=105483 RepID=UPI0004E24A1E|nr:histidinol-phosphate transaminase [Desulfofalx alkaliphila]